MGPPGWSPAGVAALRRLPFLSWAAKIEPQKDAESVRVHRISPTGFDVLEAPMPALITCTQALGEPRYPSLKGIMAARSKEIEPRDLAAVGVAETPVGEAAATTRVLEANKPPERGATRVVREPAPDAAKELVAFLAERRIV